MTIKIAELKFTSENKFWQRDAEKLRGYFANLYEEKTLFHNHYDNGGSIYRMPLIQYKVINNDLVILGLNEGVCIMAKYDNKNL